MVEGSKNVNQTIAFAHKKKIPKFNAASPSLLEQADQREGNKFDENWFEAGEIALIPPQRSGTDDTPKKDYTLRSLLENMATPQSGFSFDKGKGELCGEGGTPIIKTSKTPTGEKLSIKDPEGIDALARLAADVAVVFTVNKCPSLEAAEKLAAIPGIVFSQAARDSLKQLAGSESFLARLTEDGAVNPPNKKFKN